MVAVAPASNGPLPVKGPVPLNVQPATVLLASLLYVASSSTPARLSLNDCRVGRRVVVEAGVLDGDRVGHDVTGERARGRRRLGERVVGRPLDDDEPVAAGARAVRRDRAADRHARDVLGVAGSWRPHPPCRACRRSRCRRRSWCLPSRQCRSRSSSRRHPDRSALRGWRSGCPGTCRRRRRSSHHRHRRRPRRRTCRSRRRCRRCRRGTGCRRSAGAAHEASAEVPPAPPAAVVPPRPEMAGSASWPPVVAPPPPANGAAPLGEPPGRGVSAPGEAPPPPPATSSAVAADWVVVENSADIPPPEEPLRMAGLPDVFR